MCSIFKKKNWDFSIFLGGRRSDIFDMVFVNVDFKTNRFPRYLKPEIDPGTSREKG